MQNIYITSDTHFFHTNIAGPSVSSWKGGYRNFSSVEEMNETLFNNINHSVKENDILYHIGDWSFGGKDKIEIARKRINCKNIVLIYGNHDRNIRKDSKFKELFSSCHESLSIKLAGQRFFFYHYPVKVWEDNEEVFHCYGHCHGNLEEDFYSLSMDVGMDTNDITTYHSKYFPYHIDEVIYKMKNCRKFRPKDHHNSNTF